MLMGFGSLVRYSLAMGDPGAPPQRIAETLDENARATIRLLFFAHPQCPCTRASVAELERLLLRTSKEGHRIDARAYLYTPPGTHPRWMRTTLASRLAAIPAVRTEQDPGGMHAQAYGIRTSGHVLIYREHELIFSGGITPARGHEGRSEAWLSAADAILGGSVGSGEMGGTGGLNWPVYGCALFERDPGAAEPEQGSEDAS